ncbi:hypothetical protein HOH51_00060 [bacterium]|jgi:hypothetical protein|nr:hypothetical protein [bacterium]
MRQFLKTEKKPLSLIIKEAVFALNIVFIVSIIISAALYMHLIAMQSQFGTKHIQLSHKHSQIKNINQKLQLQILNISSQSTISKQLNVDLFEKQQLSFMPSRSEKLLIQK